MTNNDVIDGVGDTMVEIRSASTTPSCRGRLRLSQQVYIVLLIATLLLIILSTSIFGNIVQPSSVSDNHVHIRAIDNLRKTDAPSIGIDMEQPSIHERDTIEYKTYPGFIGEVSVKCGGHEARTCDECPQGNGASWCHGQCEWIDEKCVRSSQLEHLHPDYFRITARYAFQPVMNNNHVFVNVIMVRSPFRNRDDEDVYKFYRDEILFLGISSFESFPLKSPNPYSAKYESEYYLNMFPGFLHMMRDPNVYFPDSTKTILMSQSDFMLDEPQFFRQEHANDAKIYDFVYSGGDQDVETDCVGWASYNKNFSFVREALEVMCSSEFNVTGVLVANKNKADTMACTIPAACDGKIVQTTFLDQDEFFDYLVKARWVFLPQICDASPRVSTQALSMDIPLLMNRNIMGGWKYVVPGRTGEFFHDMSDFKDSLRTILDNTRGGRRSNPYKPLEFVQKHYGNINAGPKLYEFVMTHWGDKIRFPEGTTALIPTGA